MTQRTNPSLSSEVAALSMRSSRAPGQGMRPVIGLLTDFGLSDPYVAQMKGAILRRAPQVHLVDISHEIAPYQLEQAGFYLQSSHGHFPRGAIFLAVVDPGVGSDRRIICLARDGRLFLAPDNGLLTLLLHEPGHYRIFDLTPAVNVLPTVSNTFHGRDLFAPLAARLAQGESPASMGMELQLEDVMTLPSTEPVFHENSMDLRVMHIDRFGNVLLNAGNYPWFERVRHNGGCTLCVAGGAELPVCVVRTYSDLGNSAYKETKLGLLHGSQGYLEIAMDKASAAKALGLKVGDSITLGIGRATAK